MTTKRAKAWKKLIELREQGFPNEMILDYIIGNQLSGDDAAQALDDFAEENDYTFEK
ncbi:hypothetical protein [Paenibacillus sp. Y412MC10]|uniref:hypothetical protein n=1 Tax=Geobacillus sp. (strain Y412MC10) TaxID=481743 RepID=UPI00164270A7|nr:hypothetical protein [Paenibacillus sp. Y412MC10]